MSDRLGHSTISTTLDIYAHVFPAMNDEALDRFTAHFYGDGQRQSE